MAGAEKLEPRATELKDDEPVVAETTTRETQPWQRKGMQQKAAGAKQAQQEVKRSLG